MKRKRGIAKRKPKVAPLTNKVIPNVVSAHAQDEWDLDDHNNNEIYGTSELEQPQQSNIHNRKGGSQNGEFVELPVEDSTESFGGQKLSVSTSLLKKPRSQISKLSKAVSSSGTRQVSNAEKVQISGTHGRGIESLDQDPENSEEKFNVALEVIRKVMKMDAAEPFNVPVDPVAQGVPDYFDIIDTPMDFGTICYNIENRVKYKSLRDVLRDVECIWDNCCKYNKKGHYILELMKRVKKNFMNYWTEAGLYEEQQQDTDGKGIMKNSTEAGLYEEQQQETDVFSEEEVPLPSSKPHMTSNIYGYKSPLGSLANCARSLHQDREDVARPFPDKPSLTRTESYKSQQRPNRVQLVSAADYADASMRRNPRDSPDDMLDYSFNHPYPSYNPHEIPEYRSSSQKRDPYRLHHRSCQCQHCHLQLQHSHHANTFPASAGRPHGHSYLESRHTENPRRSHHHNKIYHQPEYHDHQYTPRYSQPYPPRRELCYCIQCAGKKQHQPYLIDDDDVDDAVNFFEGEFDSDCSEDWNISSAKQGPGISKRADTNYTIQRPQVSIASGYLHKQSSTKEAFVEEGFSPPTSKSTGMVGKCVPAKDPAVSMRQITNSELLDEVTQNQMPKYKPDEAQLRFCQGQSSSQPQPSSPEDLLTMVHTGSNKTKKKRGPTRCLKVFDTYGKIRITTNEDGEAVGPESSKIISFLGMLARNGHVAPLSYLKWGAIPEENKEKMWELIQAKFDINPESKFWALKSISRKWTCWRAYLKTNHYNPHDTNEARLADCNERVLPEQWPILVEYWNTPEAQAVSANAKANVSGVKLTHAAGSKSFARLREEERRKRLDGKEPSQADMFILTRTRKNGQPTTEASSTLISQLRDVAQRQQGTSEPDTIDDEVFVQVMGEDKNKSKRTQSKAHLPPDAEKIVSEAKAEVLEMKQKMVAVEQTCTNMAAQMAAMMSMMQKNFADNNKSNLDAAINPEESDYISASHSGIQASERPSRDNSKNAGKVGRRSIGGPPHAL